MKPNVVPFDDLMLFFCLGLFVCFLFVFLLLLFFLLLNVKILTELGFIK